MNSAHRSRGRRISLLLHRWHRRLGIMVSVFVVWLAISGWLLNHTAFLHLAQRSITTPLITAHYSLQMQWPTKVFNTASHWLTFNDTATWLDGRPLSVAATAPLGLVEDERALYIATATTFSVLEKNGDPIDRETSDLLPIKIIARIGRGCAGIAIGDADHVYASRDGIIWQRCDEAVQWSQAEPLSEKQRATIKLLEQPGVPLEKLIQDLHSGRFFGALGPLVVDLVGLVFVLLALSGIWMFAHQRKQRTAGINRSR